MRIRVNPMPQSNMESLLWRIRCFHGMRHHIMAAEERVLCFKRELFEQLGVFQGLRLDAATYLPAITSSANLLYLDRSAAELDPTHKQLIPYVLLFCNGKILRYRRGKGGQETRLHGLYSVGIGGHISEEDHGLFAKDRGYLDGMRRELMEEVAIDDVRETAVAVINDDSTPVGTVHFGVVHVALAPNEDVARGRSGIVGPEFVSIAEAVREPDRYETWSRLCLEQLDVLLDRAAAAGIHVRPGH